MPDCTAEENALAAAQADLDAANASLAAASADYTAKQDAAVAAVAARDAAYNVLQFWVNESQQAEQIRDAAAQALQECEAGGMGLQAAPAPRTPRSKPA